MRPPCLHHERVSLGHGDGHLPQMSPWSRRDVQEKKGRSSSYFASTAHVLRISGGGAASAPGARRLRGRPSASPSAVSPGRGQGLAALLLLEHRPQPSPHTGPDSGRHVLPGASNAAGERRLMAMLDEFAADDLSGPQRTSSSPARLPATRRRSRRCPRAPSPPSVEWTGPRRPVRMAVTLTVSEGDILADFAGTSRPAPAA